MFSHHVYSVVRLLMCLITSARTRQSKSTLARVVNNLSAHVHLDACMHMSRLLATDARFIGSSWRVFGTHACAMHTRVRCVCICMHASHTHTHTRLTVHTA